MRKVVLLAVLAAALSLLAAGLASAKHTSAAASCSKSSLKLVSGGKLTVGTDNPAYPPYYDGGAAKGSKWKLNDPTTGKGFESAVAYAVATKLGFAKSEVQWVSLPYTQSYKPGKKSFDFYLAQVSYSSQRAKVADFSAGYFNLNQAVVALKSNKIANVKTIAALQGAQLGAPIGSTSYSYIADYIKPKSKPLVYDTLNDSLSALKAKQIDGVVVDFPTAYYIANVQLTGATIVGRLPSRGTQEHFGMVFQKGNPLVACVDKALASLKTSGTLAAIERTWISSKARAPFLK